MPQYRKLYVKSTESMDIHNMPDDFTRLFWVLLPCGLDAEGRGYNVSAWLRAKIFPLRDDVTNEQIRNAMAVFEEMGMIRSYNVKNSRYFYVVNWERYQGDTSREMKSHIPAPDDEIPNNSGATQEQLASNSGATHEQLASNSCLNTNADSNTNTDSLTSLSFHDNNNDLSLSSCDYGSVLKDALTIDAQSKGRNPPIRFATYQQKRKFKEYYEQLGHEEFEELVDVAISRGRVSRASILSFLKVSVRNRGKDARENERTKRRKEQNARDVLKQLEELEEK